MVACLREGKASADAVPVRGCGRPARCLLVNRRELGLAIVGVGHGFRSYVATALQLAEDHVGRVSCAVAQCEDELPAGAAPVPVG